MTHRERILAAIQFEKTDRIPYTLMQAGGSLVPEVRNYFKIVHGLNEEDEILDFLDTDIRWLMPEYIGPACSTVAIDAENRQQKLSYSDALYRPLADAKTCDDVANYPWPNPDWFQLPDYRAARIKWPDHAIVSGLPWFGFTMFCEACSAFGMQAAMEMMVIQPDVFKAFVERQHQFVMAFLKRAVKEAKGLVDIFWLGDDFAGNDNMLISPQDWRFLIKPYLADQVRFLRSQGFYVQFHSCGAVRSVLNDFIDIGINILEVMQVTAKGMDVETLAREFGGRLAFSGGIDCQNLMIYGSPDQIRSEVKRNLDAFSNCGGYIVANAHCIDHMKGENLWEMCRSAGYYRQTA